MFQLQQTYKEESMEGVGLFWFLIIGLIAGWLAGEIMKGDGFGLVVNLIVGVIGAFLGGWIFSTLGFNASGGIIWNIVVATVGAIVLLFIVSLFKRAA